MNSNRKLKCAGCENIYYVSDTLVYRNKRCCGKQECFETIDSKVKHSNYIRQQKKKAKGTYRHGVPVEIKKEIIIRDGKECKLCYKSCDDKEVQVHHIVPVSNKGTDDYNNLIVLCNSCHTKVHQIGWENYVDNFQNLINVYCNLLSK